MTVIIDGTTGVASVAGSAAAPSVTGNDTDTGMWQPAANVLAFSTGGTERLRLDSSGNLGLGVTPSGWSPGKAIEVGNAGNGLYGTGANDMLVTSGAYYNSGWKYAITNSLGASAYEQYNSQHRWYVVTPAAHNAGDAITFTQAMTLDASGNLLVGDTSLVGNECGLFSKASTTYNVLVAKNSSASGNVGGILSTFGSNGNNTSSWFFQGSCTGVANYYLYGNGTSSFTSDVRKKKNIETARDGYAEDLCKLRVVKYNWFNHDDGASKELGLIAQEVEQVFPGLVQDDPNPDADGVTYKTLKTSVLPFMLLKAIQELTARVAQLEGAK